MSYEKDKLDSYVTSTSMSIAVATDLLTVRGPAAVSATLSAGAVTVAGRPVGNVLLAFESGANKTQFSFSGSWSDYCILEMRVFEVFSASGNPQYQVFTDGGTSSILRASTTTPLGGTIDGVYLAHVYGGDGADYKVLEMQNYTTAGGNDINVTATANSGTVNCIKFVMTATASFAFAALYGYRKT